MLFQIDKATQFAIVCVPIEAVAWRRGALPFSLTRYAAAVAATRDEHSVRHECDSRTRTLRLRSSGFGPPRI